MFVFGLHSTSDDWPSDLEQKIFTETQKNEKGPLSHDDRPSNLSEKH